MKEAVELNGVGKGVDCVKVATWASVTGATTQPTLHLQLGLSVEV